MSHQWSVASDTLPQPGESSRRRFLRMAGVGAAALAVSAGAAPQGSGKAPKAATPRPPVPLKPTKLKLGLASYSLRKFDLDKTLEMTSRVGLEYIALKSMHLPLESTPEQIAAAVAKVKAAKLILYGAGVISMAKEEQVNQAFDYAKAAAMPRIIIAPKPEMLPLINKKVQEYDIQVCIHNHGPTDKVFPTPDSAYAAIKDLDPRVGLCIDIGHTVRVGTNLIESTEKCFDRVFDVHIKDVTGPTAKDFALEVGRGTIDIPGFLRTLIRLKYSGVVAFEYEEQPDDPLPGLAESVGYTKGVLAML